MNNVHHKIYSKLKNMDALSVDVLNLYMGNKGTLMEISCEEFRQLHDEFNSIMYILNFGDD